MALKNINNLLEHHVKVLIFHSLGRIESLKKVNYPSKM